MTTPATAPSGSAPSPTASTPRAFVPRSWRVATRWVPASLQAVGILALVIALARPAERVVVTEPREGIDIVLCLDISSSMTSTDLDAERSRLRLAREAAGAFIDARRHDRIGLITFARFPDLRSPPTLDHEALLALLDEVRPVAADGPEDATGLGAAVARGAEVLSEAADRGRVLIVLTDGEETVALAGAVGAIAPTHAAQLCAQLGVRVYPIVAGQGRRGVDGSWVPLDTSAVEQMAVATGGAFQQARDAASLRRVYETIDAMEAAPAHDTHVEVEDRLLPFVLVGLALLALGALLQATIWRQAP